MGQFVVNDASGVKATGEAGVDYTVYPNPAKDRLYFAFPDPSVQAYYVTITNAIGRTMCMLPRPQLQYGIDISNYAPGTYLVQLIDEQTKNTVTRKFVKE
jgi:hypothetical protein